MLNWQSGYVRADRLLQIVTLLRQHDRLSATELARRLEVTPRTVLRDMDALSTAGIPVYAERGRNGGFALLPGFRPVTEELTAAETQALLLAGLVPAEQLGLGGPLTSALRKLAGAAPPEYGRSAARVSDRILVDPAGWAGSPEPLTHLPTVQTAVLDDRRLRLRYRSRDSAAVTTRTVDAYGLVQAGGVWYLLGAHRGRPRSYRVSRIQAATVLTDVSRRPADLDLRALWTRLRDQFASRPSTTVVMTCEPGAYDLVTRLLADQGSSAPRVLDVGPPVRFEAEVYALRAVIGVLAGLGAWVRYLEPPELVALAVTIAEETRALYPTPSRDADQSTATASGVDLSGGRRGSVR